MICISAPQPPSRSTGFTLIEILLYVTIVTLILTSVITLGWNIILSGTKSAVLQDVSDSARFVAEVIKSEIRNASAVNSVSSSSLSLSTFTPSTNPTVIDLDNGRIRIKRGLSSAQPLNASPTYASSLVFTDLSTPGGSTATSQHIGFSFTLISQTGSSRREYQAAVTASSSAEIRSHQPN